MQLPARQPSKKQVKLWCLPLFLLDSHTSIWKLMVRVIISCCCWLLGPSRCCRSASSSLILVVITLIIWRRRQRRRRRIMMRTHWKQNRNLSGSKLISFRSSFPSRKLAHSFSHSNSHSKLVPIIRWTLTKSPFNSTKASSSYHN